MLSIYKIWISMNRFSQLLWTQSHTTLHSLLVWICIYEIFMVNRKTPFCSKNICKIEFKLTQSECNIVNSSEDLFHFLKFHCWHPIAPLPHFSSCVHRVAGCWWNYISNIMRSWIKQEEELGIVTNIYCHDVSIIWHI